MRRAFVLLLVAVLAGACEQFAPSVSSGDGAGGSGQAGASAEAPCRGFRTIEGQCIDPACLQSNECDASVKDSCGPGAGSDSGACFAGRCAWPDTGRGCGSSQDCPCGMCGTDGRCYEDRSGGCGACVQGGATGSQSSGKDSGACKSCLASCAGTGPSCCASGDGCVCDGQCGGFL